MKGRIVFIYTSILLVSVTLLLGSMWPRFYFGYVIMIPIIVLGIMDMMQKKHSIKRNFPVVGHLRYILERFRPEIMQYFVESDTEGRPINRIFRSIVYQRAKNVNDTASFGTQMEVYEAGYEWMEHSVYARSRNKADDPTRVWIGGRDCKKPYPASLLNISAMSYGALSRNAVLALNKGAKMGGFAHNTGEGGISDYHLENGGDLIWQIGTGYFGCRDAEGKFSVERFRETSVLDNVKMIELKISQGAKPGHGGILPAKKNTVEIAAMRGVPPFTDVHSPASHSAFSNPKELMQFLHILRVESGGKPVGFKLCIGKKNEFVDICCAMVSTGIKPDFITIDGGEGGSGAAPVEFTNSMGMPLRDGLAFAYDTLVGFDLKKDIKLIAAGKIFTGFHMARIIALGADICNSARGMMLALGCIQALQCNNNSCPVGVATQDKRLMNGLDIGDKATRVYHFHKATLNSFTELLAATGIDHPDELKRCHIHRRVAMDKVMTYADIYPELAPGDLLKNEH